MICLIGLGKNGTQNMGLELGLFFKRWQWEEGRIWKEKTSHQSIAVLELSEFKGQVYLMRLLYGRHSCKQSGNGRGWRENVKGKEVLKQKVSLQIIMDICSIISWFLYFSICFSQNMHCNNI